MGGVAVARRNDEGSKEMVDISARDGGRRIHATLDDGSAADAKAVVTVVDDGKLARGDALDLLLAVDLVSALYAADAAPCEVGRVANFERDFTLIVERPPGVGGDEVESGGADRPPILRFGVVAVGDVDDVRSGVFADDEPGATTHAEAFALADGVKPEAMVTADGSARLPLHDIAVAATEVALDEVVVANLSEEADALAVLTARAGQARRLSQAADFMFHQVADGEEQLGDL